MPGRSWCSGESARQCQPEKGRRRLSSVARWVAVGQRQRGCAGKEPGRVQRVAARSAGTGAGCRCRCELQRRPQVRVAGTGACAGGRCRRGRAWWARGARRAVGGGAGSHEQMVIWGVV